MLYDAKRWEPKIEVPKIKKAKKKVPSKATFRRRLLKLATMLEADAKNAKGMKFDLKYIGVKSGWTPFLDTGPVVEFEPKIDCGTSGCALGLAAMSGAFEQQGLSYWVNPVGLVETKVNGHKVGYISAGKKIFGLSEEESNFLFGPDWYPANRIEGAKAERYVANRIRQFVAGKTKKQMEYWKRESGFIAD